MGGTVPLAHSCLSPHHYSPDLLVFKVSPSLCSFPLMQPDHLPKTLIGLHYFLDEKKICSLQYESKALNWIPKMLYDLASSCLISLSLPHNDLFKGV